VTPTSQTNAEALQQVQSLWQAAGAVVLTMDPYLHDKILGAVSHLPHVAAFALMNALVDIRTEVPALDLAGHSGGGLRDTTRIAASSPEMWRDIFLWNRENLVAWIRAYERSLGELRRLIQAGDAAGIEKMLERAKEEREKFPIRT
jgi:prephenate dehydrogenase